MAFTSNLKTTALKSFVPRKTRLVPRISRNILNGGWMRSNSAELKPYLGCFHIEMTKKLSMPLFRPLYTAFQSVIETFRQISVEALFRRYIAYSAIHVKIRWSIGLNYLLESSSYGALLIKAGLQASRGVKSLLKEGICIQLIPLTIISPFYGHNYGFYTFISVYVPSKSLLVTYYLIRR